MRYKIMEFKLKDDILTINGEAYKLVPVEEQQMQEKARTGWERVNYGEKYYYVDTQSNSDWVYDEFSYYSDKMYESCNYFNNKQLCDNIGRAISIYLRMLRWQAENDVPVDIHNPSTAKWCISYDSSDKELYATYSKNLLGTFEVFFSTKAKAQECIRAFESDLLWLHTQFYHRLDGKGVDNAEM